MIILAPLPDPPVRPVRIVAGRATVEYPDGTRRVLWLRRIVREYPELLYALAESGRPL